MMNETREVKFKVAGEYSVYEFVKKDTNNEFIFVNPNNSPYKEVTDLMKRGYSLCRVEYMDKERYLNERLNVRVQEYLSLDEDEQSYKSMFTTGQITEDTLYSTLNIIIGQKVAVIQQIKLLVGRIIREDYSVYNEIALGILDSYKKSICFPF